MKKQAKKRYKDKLIDLEEILKECAVISFNPKDVARRLEKIYSIRNKAHELLLQADTELDILLKELSGYEKEK